MVFFFHSIFQDVFQEIEILIFRMIHIFCLNLFFSPFRRDASSLPLSPIQKSSSLNHIKLRMDDAAPEFDLNRKGSMIDNRKSKFTGVAGCDIPTSDMESAAKSGGAGFEVDGNSIWQIYLFHGRNKVICVRLKNKCCFFRREVCGDLFDFRCFALFNTQKCLATDNGINLTRTQVKTRSFGISQFTFCEILYE